MPSPVARIDNSLARPRLQAERRENVELTLDCGGLLDACAEALAKKGDESGIVLGRSAISTRGLAAFHSLDNGLGDINPACSAICRVLAENYPLIHSNGKEAARSVIYDQPHHNGIVRLKERYFLGKPLIYARRAVIAFGLATQDEIKLTQVNISGELRNFLTNLGRMF